VKEKEKEREKDKGRERERERRKRKRKGADTERESESERENERKREKEGAIDQFLTLFCAQEAHREGASARETQSKRKRRREGDTNFLLSFAFSSWCFDKYLQFTNLLMCVRGHTCFFCFFGDSHIRRALCIVLQIVSFSFVAVCQTLEIAVFLLLIFNSNQG